MANLLWLQGGACSGNTMSFLNAEEPSACDLVTDFGINVLWHPSLGLELGENLRRMLDAIVSGEIALDIFVYEGTVVNAPNGTGEWNRFCSRPMKDWVSDLAKVATFTVAVGDCALDGGIFAGGYACVAGLSKVVPVDLHIPGCPPSPTVLLQGLIALLEQNSR